MEKFEKISSIDNPQIKQLKKLNLKKFRQETGKFLVENLVIIEDALSSGFDFLSIFVTEEFVQTHAKEIGGLVKKNQSGTFYLITEKLNKHYSNLDTPSGITAIFESRKSEIDTKKPVIYLNGISDPGNLGTILRTALSFNFTNIIVDETCAEIFNPKVINAAKDSIFKLHFDYDENREWLKANKEEFPIYVTSSHFGTNLSKFKPSKLFCLVLGNESHGVSKEIQNLATENIMIEMSKNMESLNVASAAAILFYNLSK